ncbi:MAG: prepilin-type N-terminal cleavage/methylation domain-containing protein [Proteobacteria bacterium]|nr:prepilin-type N-terminal cleavage/methylation domain-containing protein [Pseudomonadota bacterium]
MPNSDRNKHSRGFTLVELVIVICILSILATIAVLVYTQSKVSQYDEEAIANLSDLYMQSNELITTWGVGTNTNYEIPVGCLPVNPPDTSMTSGSGQMATNTGNWQTLGLIIPGLHRWQYQICFGHFPSTGTTKPEGFVLVAHKSIDGKDRFIVYGSGIESPIVDAAKIPDFARLESTVMSQLAYSNLIN